MVKFELGKPFSETKRPGRTHSPQHILGHDLIEVSSVSLTVLMLVNRLNIGGTETHVLSLAKQLKKVGVDCFWQSKIPEHGSVDVHSTLT